LSLPYLRVPPLGIDRTEGPGLAAAFFPHSIAKRWLAQMAVLSFGARPALDFE
jgi:hypothetical protein